MPQHDAIDVTPKPDPRAVAFDDAIEAYRRLVAELVEHFGATERDNGVIEEDAEGIGCLGVFANDLADALKRARGNTTA